MKIKAKINYKQFKDESQNVNQKKRRIQGVNYNFLLK